MKRRLAVILTFALCCGAMAQAQGGHGNRGGQQGGQGRPQTAGQGSGTMQGTQSQVQERARIHATSQQRQQLGTCTQSTERLRSRVREMSRISAGEAIKSEQAKQWREQLRSELQNMNQQHEAFMNGLTAEQKSGVQERTREMETSRLRLDDFAEALDMELALDSPDPVKVKNNAKLMEKELDRVRTQQRNLQSELI